MKRKNDLKKDPMKAIEPAMLDEILGSVQSNANAGQNGAVIRQDSFSSFFHS